MREYIKKMFSNKILFKEELDSIWNRVYDPVQTSLFNRPMLNIIKLDECLKLEYKDEYPEGMSMKSFIETKFGIEFSDNFTKYII